MRGLVLFGVLLCYVGSVCTDVKECHESPNSEWNQMWEEEERPGEGSASAGAGAIDSFQWLGSFESIH